MNLHIDIIPTKCIKLAKQLTEGRMQLACAPR